MAPKRIDDIFEECLERVFSGEPVEQCISKYPEHASELRGLLETAMAAKKAVTIEPSPEFRARARAQLQAVLREREPVRRQERRPFTWGWYPRWAVALTAFVVLMAGGSGVVLASNGSMPGQPLYFVKQVTEQARLAVTTSPTAKAELYAGLAERRVDEIVYLANNNEPERLQEATRELDNCLTQISELSGGVGEKAVLSARNSDAGGTTNDSTYGIISQEAGDWIVPGMTPAPTTAPMSGVVPPATTTTDTKTFTIASPSADEEADGALAKLKTRVIYQSVELPALLKATMAGVSPEVRLALLQAIAVSETGYEMILQSLANSQ